MSLRLTDVNGESLLGVTIQSNPSAVYNKEKQRWENGHDVDMSGFESTDDEVEPPTPQAEVAPPGPAGADEEEDWDADFADDIPAASIATMPLPPSPSTHTKTGSGPTLITMADMESGAVQVAAPHHAPGNGAEALLNFFREEEPTESDLSDLGDLSRTKANRLPKPKRPEPLEAAAAAGAADAAGAGGAGGAGGGGGGVRLLRPEDVSVPQVAGQGGQHSVFDPSAGKWVQVAGLTSFAIHDGVEASDSDFELLRAVRQYFKRCETEHQDVMRLILGEPLFRRLRREGRARLASRSKFLRSDQATSESESEDSGADDDAEAEDLEDAYGTDEHAEREWRKSMRKRQRRKNRLSEGDGAGPRSASRSGSRRVSGRRIADAKAQPRPSKEWTRSSGPVVGTARAVAPSKPLTQQQLRERTTNANIARHERQLRRFREARMLAEGRLELRTRSQS